METALGRAVIVALSLTFAVPLSAVAENSEPYSFKSCSAQKQCRKLSHAELGRLRGGLSVSGANSAMQLTFGITQVVYVNDEVVALTQLLLPAVNQALGAGTPSAPQLQTRNSALPTSQAAPASAVGAGAAPATVPTAMAANATKPASSPPTTSAATGPTAPAVFVNGVQATAANPVVINVPSADELRALIVQNGAGNSVPNASDLRAATMATVIQNTQDNQTIRTVTTVNVSIAVSEARRAMAIGNAMRNSLR